MVVADSYVEILPGLVGMVVKLISAVIMMIVLDWRFACVLLPCGILLIIFTYAFRKVLKKLHKQVQERDGKLRTVTLSAKHPAPSRVSAAGFRMLAPEPCLHIVYAHGSPFVIHHSSPL